MILSDRGILDRLETGDLVIDPIEDLNTQVQPASVDLRLGNTFLEFERANVPCIRPHNPDTDLSEYVTETQIEDSDEFILHPGDFVLGTTREHVEIPADLLAHIEGRSSLGRLAIIIHATAGIIDSGYEGQITLELSNLGPAPVALTPGMRVSQLILTQLTTPAERPYGEERGSKYQGQTGPQASRLESDPDI